MGPKHVVVTSLDSNPVGVPMANPGLEAQLALETAEKLQHGFVKESGLIEVAG